jgi:hypothetical protein
MVVSLVLIIPAVLAVLYLLIWQTYVLRQIRYTATRLRLKRRLSKPVSYSKNAGSNITCLF